MIIIIIIIIIIKYNNKRKKKQLKKMGEKRKTSRAQWSIINAKDKSHILECGV